MADARDNQKPASLGGDMEQSTFSEEWKDEDCFTYTVFPAFTGMTDGNIPFFKCHPGAQNYAIEAVSLPLDTDCQCPSQDDRCIRKFRPRG